MSPMELEEAGFRLRRDHQPVIDFSELRDRKESSEQYYARSLYVTQCILRLTAHIGASFEFSQSRFFEDIFWLS